MFSPPFQKNFVRLGVCLVRILPIPIHYERKQRKGILPMMDYYLSMMDDHRQQPPTQPFGPGYPGTPGGFPGGYPGGFPGNIQQQLNRIERTLERHTDRLNRLNRRLQRVERRLGLPFTEEF
jgi:hypothetical protein